MGKRKKDEPGASPPEPSSQPVQQAAPGENGSQNPRRPVASFRCASGKDTYVQASVWENEVRSQNGDAGTQHVVSFSRSYKNGEGWKTMYNYRVNDLMILQHLLSRAFAWIADHRVILDQPVAAPVSDADEALKEPVPF